MSRPSIFITGAAAGIGRATARLFAQQGWFVGLYDIDSAELTALVDELGAELTCSGILDVRDSNAWSHALNDFFTVAGQRLDVLFNNAGVLASGPFTDTPLNTHEQLIDINLKGVVNGCHSVLPYLQQTPRSRVINMASASAIYGQPSLATYSATKFAVRGLTEALDLEWNHHGIRVMAIWPTFVQTQMVEGMKAKSLKVMGVTLTAEDVAQAVWKAANHRGGAKVHWPVGWQSHLLTRLGKVTPDWLDRIVNLAMNK